MTWLQERMASRERKTLKKDRMKKCVKGQVVIFGSNEERRIEYC